MFVFDIDVQRAQTFSEQLTTDWSKEINTTVIAVEELSQAIKQSDIITTVTTSKVATFNAEDVKQGTHVNGIGTYTPDMKEMPSELIAKADRVIYDTNDGVLAEAGDIISPLKEGLVTRDDYQGELGEVVLETLKVRETVQEITVFKSVGTVVLDVVTAQAIYKKANEKNLGQRVLEG